MSDTMIERSALHTAQKEDEWRVAGDQGWTHPDGWTIDRTMVSGVDIFLVRNTDGKMHGPNGNTGAAKTAFRRLCM
ncbi:hypothetical protein DIE23_30205 [Burkholderia sp. Bp9143]|uniref:hypothetical protein n=1 Tax=Burkholderia sp. Bp9143 TaxID=2184574 RepID=UPI000F5A8F58|nr:hypothetical protein [Burkholderia sp. Bp9143]RQR26371.1 hypothetical protein DIE23_30205 [Burkholderia sp. Bp9143]